MKLSWSIGDTVEVVKETVPFLDIGTKGEIIELCDEDSISPYYGVDFGTDNDGIWWYSEDELKLISKAEDN